MQLGYVDGPSTVSGSCNVTLVHAASSASGTFSPSPSGSVAATLSNAVMAASGGLTITGTGNAYTDAAYSTAGGVSTAPLIPRATLSMVTIPTASTAMSANPMATVEIS